jgi:uncharacterized protein with GYD domain
LSCWLISPIKEFVALRVTEARRCLKVLAEKKGAKVREVFWTLGSYDMVVIIETPDTETVTAIGMSVAKLGNVRTQTVSAFDEAEMGSILREVL